MGSRRGRNGNGNGNGSGVAGFNLATLVQVLIIPGITLVGFYYVTKDKLQEHDLAIYQTIPKQLDTEHQALVAEADARQKAVVTEAAAREKSRNEFLDKFDKLNAGMATLNTQVAVEAEQNKQIVQTLGQIRDQLVATAGRTR